MKSSIAIPMAIIALCAASPAVGSDLQSGEGPNLGDRISQQMIESELSLRQIRSEGQRVFATPFNQYDGFGDGPDGRPTLQNNGAFLRMNGLDSQTCLECHNVLSSAKIPATFAVGGAGGVSASAFPGVIDPDIDDSENNGFAAIQGRMINPPFNFGVGGLELLAKEMTADLQALKELAEANPGAGIDLTTKGIDFGWIVFDDGEFDTAGIEGIDDDLVVRPFGRKGCCATVRAFDVGAMQFHHGMQPVEVFGEGVDDDGDGVADELTIGEMSALHIFQVTLRRPEERNRTRQSRRGRRLFEEIGCAQCHVPSLTTTDRSLSVSFPEVETDPTANVYKSIDLARHAGFRKTGHGLKVPLYADLKRHDMGDDLAESTGGDLDRQFTTARLWGVADSAPYLHDGRAMTLTEAILLHGGESSSSRDIFEVLTDEERDEILVFLRTLRTPRKPSQGLDGKTHGRRDRDGDRDHRDRKDHRGRKDHRADRDHDRHGHGSRHSNR